MDFTLHRVISPIGSSAAVRLSARTQEGNVFMDFAIPGQGGYGTRLNAEDVKHLGENLVKIADDAIASRRVEYEFAFRFPFSSTPEDRGFIPGIVTVAADSPRAAAEARLQSVSPWSTQRWGELRVTEARALGESTTFAFHRNSADSAWEIVEQ